MDQVYVDDFKKNFLTGIQNVGDDETLAFYLDSAYSSVERDLTLVLKKQDVTEQVDHIPADQNKLIKVRTTWPVNSIESDVEAWFGNTKLITFSKEISVRTIQSYGQVKARGFYLMPNFTNSPVYNGAFYSYTNPFQALQSAPQANFYGYSTFPGYWHVTYNTGFDEIPADILQLLYMRAARSYLVTLGDTVDGFATNSQQLEVDGLKQNIYKQQGQYGPFSGRINMYLKEEEVALRKLKARYVGIRVSMI